jgi:hypothetical protein
MYLGKFQASFQTASPLDYVNMASVNRHDTGQGPSREVTQSVPLVNTPRGLFNIVVGTA